MACFLAAVAESAIVYGIKKTVQSHHSEKAQSWARRLGILINMLLGGSFLLMIEHVWHGEITWHFPFLTAMRDPDDTAAMIHEIMTVGVSMDLALTAAWAVWVLASSMSARSAAKEA